MTRRGVPADAHDDDMAPGMPATAVLNRARRFDIIRPATILRVERDKRGKVRRLTVRYEDNGVEAVFTRKYLGSVFRNNHMTYGPSARDAYRLIVGTRDSGNIIFNAEAA